MLRRLLLLPLRLLAHLTTWLLALLVLFEEWGWEPLQRLLARIGRWPGLRWVEYRVRALPPWAALAAFGVPTLLLLPIKLLALWAIGSGQMLLGATVVIAAKIIGTAVVARLFTLTRPALMRLAWFATFYVRWIGLKTALLAYARASWPWRAARVLRQRTRRWWRRTRPG